jgi:hypothetical protein
MFKGRFRLPSPALVLAMVALAVALGGTAFAANSVATAKHKSKHKDAKADTKLVKKMAPKLSVKHAKTANSAKTAASATHATSADSATNATNATHATSADSATNATNSTNLGGHPASFYSPTVLQSGQSESGTYAVATGTTSGGYLAQGFAFPVPLAAALSASHVAWLNGTTTANCPGVGHAAAGYLCVYATAAASVTENNGHAVSTHAGQGGADAYGFMLFFNGTSSNAFSYGSWTVTAP